MSFNKNVCRKRHLYVVEFSKKIVGRIRKIKCRLSFFNITICRLISSDIEYTCNLQMLILFINIIDIFITRLVVRLLERVKINIDQYTNFSSGHIHCHETLRGTSYGKSRDDLYCKGNLTSFCGM